MSDMNCKTMKCRYLVLRLAFFVGFLLVGFFLAGFFVAFCFFGLAVTFSSSILRTSLLPSFLKATRAALLDPVGRVFPCSHNPTDTVLIPTTVAN